MDRQTKLQALRERPSPSPTSQRPRAWLHGVTSLRGEAETMLRDIAFVLHATRSVRETVSAGNICLEATPA
jgi:hypothetical protein